MMAADPLVQALAQLTGQRIAGGCEDCDAYRTLDASQAPVVVLRVHHDETCPHYRRINRSSG